MSLLFFLVISTFASVARCHNIEESCFIKSEIFGAKSDTLMSNMTHLVENYDHKMRFKNMKWCINSEDRTLAKLSMQLDSTYSHRKIVSTNLVSSDKPTNKCWYTEENIASLGVKADANRTRLLDVKIKFNNGMCRGLLTN